MKLFEIYQVDKFFARGSHSTEYFDTLPEAIKHAELWEDCLYNGSISICKGTAVQIAYRQFKSKKIFEFHVSENTGKFYMSEVNASDR